MKVPRSERASELLSNPQTARLLSDAVRRAGYGPENAVTITVPAQQGKPAYKLDVYLVPKAG